MSGAAGPRLPEVDVVVPAFDEEACLGDCLDTVFGQDYPADRLHVWVVDAGSTDGTAEVVRARARGEPRLSLITGCGRLNAGEALRLGMAAGHAELVLRVDAHTYLAPDYLRRGVADMAEAGPRLALVSGQPAQLGETRFGRAVACARRSRVGVGGSVYADRRARAVVDTVQGGVYRRSALDAVGGFATGFRAGEDEECNWRLRRAGYDVLLDTGLAFAYTTRSTWTAVFRQHRNYGASRALVIAHHPGFVRPRHLAPGALVAGAGALAVAAAGASGRGARAARRGLAALLGAYGAAVAAGAAAAARHEPRLAPDAAAALVAMHLGYGVGTLEGAASLAARTLGLAAPRTRVTRR